MTDLSPSDIAGQLASERRIRRLGYALSALRVVLVLAVQACLLLGYALLFVRPPDGVFYVALFALCANALLLGLCLALFMAIRGRIRAACRQ